MNGPTVQQAVILGALAAGTALFLRKHSFSAPCDSRRLRRDFGWWWTKRLGDRFHTGIDFNLPKGSEVRAAKAGTVVSVNDNAKADGFGVFIMLIHSDGTLTKYCHLQSVSAAKGQEVRRGEIIGLSGNSGHTRKRPMLHFEIRTADEKPLNPWEVLRW